MQPHFLKLKNKGGKHSTVCLHSHLHVKGFQTQGQMQAATLSIGQQGHGRGTIEMSELELISSLDS
jgi:hypothetical protein